MPTDMNQINSPESKEKKSFSQKTKNFINNTKKAVRDAIATTGIAVSTLIPASVESLTTIAPTAAKVVAVPTAAALVSACERPDDVGPQIVTEVKDREISGGETLTIANNQVKIGNKVLQEFKDDVSPKVTISANLNGKPVQSGTIVNEGGVLTSIARDEAQNPSATARTTITKKEVIEEIKCSTHLSTVDITKGEQITRNGNAIFAGTQKTFAWDNNDYTLGISFNGDSNVKLPITIEDNSNITFTLSYKGKSASRTTEIKANDVENPNKAPEITREYPQDKVPNILGGVTAKGENNKLTFGDVVIYEGKDDNTEVCTPSLKLKGNNEEKIGKEVKVSGTYVFTLTDKEGKSTPVEFNVDSKSIDLSNLSNLNMQVGQEADLLQGISIPSGIQISKVEVETNGQRSEVKENNGQYLYTPAQPGTCYIYITEKGEFGNTYVEKSKEQTIKDIEHPEYQAISINNIKPEEVFPQITQIEAGDPNIYKYVEDLRVAETYVMRDMMGKYGTGKHSPEEYQQLLSRVIIGLIEEKPDNYQDYERIGPAYTPYIYDHGNNAFKNLILLQGKQTKVMNLSGRGDGRAKNLSEYAKAHPNNIFIFSNSSTKTAYSQTDYKQNVFDKNITDLCDLPNVIIFVAGGDTETENGVNLKIIYNGAYDEKLGEGRYLYSSMANSDQNNYPNSNMRIVIGNHPSGSVDVSNSEGSLFPYGFDNNVTISGHPVLPIYRNGRFRGEDYAARGGYFSSYVAPTVASEVQEIFGLHADVTDADKLLEMIESCTASPDYISLNGKKQALQKYSSANFAEKYCMIMDIPSSIKPGETVILTKGRYKGLVLNIAGTEVKINGQWVEYNKANESLIKSQNPMNLEQRINGDLVAKYSKNGSVKGKLIAVDDQWNGLNMEKDISISVN